MICVQHYKYHCKILAKNASEASHLFFYSEKIDWQMHLTTDEKYQSSRIKTTLDVVWFKKNLDHLFWLFRWDGSTGVVDLEKVTDVFRFSCKGLVHHHLSSHSWMDIDFLHHFHCPPRRKRMPSAREQREREKKSVVSYWTKGEREKA